MHSFSSGKLTLLDIGNNEISSRGAFHVAEYIKKAKSLLWLNLYMNDIGDEVLKFFCDFNNLQLRLIITLSSMFLLSIEFFCFYSG